MKLSLLVATILIWSSYYHIAASASCTCEKLRFKNRYEDDWLNVEYEGSDDLTFDVHTDDMYYTYWLKCDGNDQLIGIKQWKCLQVVFPGDNPDDGPLSNYDVDLKECNEGQHNQKWKIENVETSGPYDEEYYIIKNPHHNCCLDVYTANGDIDCYPCDRDNEQQHFTKKQEK